MSSKCEKCNCDRCNTCNTCDNCDRCAGEFNFIRFVHDGFWGDETARIECMQCYHALMDLRDKENA